MSEIIKKQVVINRIKLPYEILSVIKDYVFNDIVKYMLKIKICNCIQKYIAPHVQSFRVF